MHNFVVINEDGAYLVYHQSHTHTGLRDNFYWTDDLDCAAVFLPTQRRLLTRNKLDKYVRIPAKVERKVILGFYEV